MKRQKFVYTARAGDNTKFVYIPKTEQKANFVYKELSKKGEIVNKVGNILRFGHNKDWFVLIYPSNYYIKVYSEAKRDSLARLYCETATELIKLIISRI